MTRISDRDELLLWSSKRSLYPAALQARVLSTQSEGGPASTARSEGRDLSSLLAILAQAETALHCRHQQAQVRIVTRIENRTHL